MSAFDDWSRREFIQRTGLAVLTAGSLEAFLAACGGNSSGTTGGSRVEGGALYIIFPNQEAADAKGLDPNIGGGATYVNSIYSAIFDQLVYQDPATGKLAGGLAEKWDISGDGTQITFHLKTTPKFHDGTPVTADDVKYTLDRAVDKRYLPGNAYTTTLMANYASSTVINQTTIQVNLKGPQASFLPSVVGRTYLAIVPKAYVEKIGPAAANDKPMGSGPFQFVEWVKGDHITVKKNPAYTWGPSFTQTAGRAPSVDKIVFRFILDDTTRLAALQSGQVNAIQSIPPYNQSEFETDNRYQILHVRKNGLPGGIDLQTTKFPTDDLAVRQALAYSVDRDAINKAVYAGKHFPAYHFLEDKMGSWVNKNAVLPQRDVGKAKSVLDAAGWAVGSNGMRSKGGQPLALKTLCTADLQQAMTLIQSQVKEAGIELNIQVMSGAAISNITQSSPGDYNVVWSLAQGFTNEDPNVLYSNYDTKNIPGHIGTTNTRHFSDPAVDQLLEQGAVTVDQAKRQSLYYQAQEKLVAEVPSVPLLSFNLNRLLVKGVNGVLPDIRGSYTYFHDVWIDKSIQSKWK